MLIDINDSVHDPPPKPRICLYCRFYTGGDWCDKLNGFDEGAVDGAWGADGAAVCVGPEFGCNHWKGKNDD